MSPSGNALHMCMLACLSACLGRPFVNFVQTFSSTTDNIPFYGSAKSKNKGLLPDCSVGMKDTGSKDDQVKACMAILLLVL